jgi:hypothetical protein
VLWKALKSHCKLGANGCALPLAKGSHLFLVWDVVAVFPSTKPSRSDRSKMGKARQIFRQHDALKRNEGQ